MRLKNTRFDEDMLWDIADSCVAALAYMQEQNIPHGYMDAEHVYLVIDEWKLFPV